LKMKKYLKALLSVPPALLAVLYGGGFAGQFIANYTAWQDAGGTAGDGSAPAFPSGNILECLKTALNFPYGLYGILICLLLIGLLILPVMKMGFGDKGEYDRERNLTCSPKGTYGTAGFMTENRFQKKRRRRIRNQFCREQLSRNSKIGPCVRINILIQ